MTTCVAIVNPKLHVAVVGADGQITMNGSSIAKLTAKKFTRIKNPNGDMAFAFAGSALGGVAAARLFRECAAAEKSPENAILEFQKNVERFDKPALYKNDAVGIVAWPGGLYRVATTDLPIKVDKEVSGFLIAGIGSGAPYALGALAAMVSDPAVANYGDAATAPALMARLVEKAIAIAIENDCFSGGTPATEVLS